MGQVNEKPGGERGIRAVDPIREPGSPTVIFLHLGKTAGSTLRQVLRRNYTARETLKADRPGMPREGTLDDFARLPMARRNSARLVIGHTIFGIHEMLPQPSTYVTMVRDPFKLVLSQYRFVLRRPHHRLHETVTSRGLSLVDYIRSGISKEMDNGQTRAIAGDTSTPFGQCTEDMLRTAQRNIEEYFVVTGVTERFDETLLLLRRALAWSHLCYVRANVSPSGASLEELPRDTVRLIEEHTALDRELYAFVRQRFDETISRLPSFDRELQRFRTLNRLYGPWGWLTYSIPKRSLLRLKRREARLASES
jgi:hypothetical protein